jgi:hypothetical protein
MLQSSIITVRNFRIVDRNFGHKLKQNWQKMSSRIADRTFRIQLRTDYILAIICSSELWLRWFQVRWKDKNELYNINN